MTCFVTPSFPSPLMGEGQGEGDNEVRVKKSSRITLPLTPSHPYDFAQGRKGREDFLVKFKCRIMGKLFKQLFLTGDDKSGENGKA